MAVEGEKEIILFPSSDCKKSKVQSCRSCFAGLKITVRCFIPSSLNSLQTPILRCQVNDGSGLCHPAPPSAVRGGQTLGNNLDVFVLFAKVTGKQCASAEEESFVLLAVCEMLQ